MYLDFPCEGRASGKVELLKLVVNGKSHVQIPPKFTRVPWFGSCGCT